MPNVRGIGGIFFKSQDPGRLMAWYAQHLGIASKPGSGAFFKWRAADGADREGITVWSVFPRETKYFEPSKSEFMINYIVDDLDSTLNELRQAGVEVDEKVERSDYGNFGWITDPDGNRIELWQPK
jgi:predicted enzyme related to lactoylglutathione lyase